MEVLTNCTKIAEVKEQINNCEDAFIRAFAVQKPFSENLVKWSDELFPDKYDHNYFKYFSQFTETEYLQAIGHQKEKEANFLKFEGTEKLVNHFNMEESHTLIMTYVGHLKDFGNCELSQEEPGKCNSDHADKKIRRNIFINKNVTFQKPSLEEVTNMELRHYGKIYGEDFTRRNIKRLYEKIDFAGAYLNEELAGYCYTFINNNVVNIDGLLVDEAYRRQGIAAALLLHIAVENPEMILYLHADADDKPRKLYEKLGFIIIGDIFEYFVTIQSQVPDKRFMPA